MEEVCRGLVWCESAQVSSYLLGSSAASTPGKTLRSREDSIESARRCASRLAPASARCCTMEGRPLSSDAGSLPKRSGEGRDTGIEQPPIR